VPSIVASGFLPSAVWEAGRHAHDKQKKGPRFKGISSKNVTLITHIAGDMLYFY